MPKYGNFENQPVSRKLLRVVSAKISSILTPWGRKNYYVQLLALWPLAKFHAQIWQFWKLPSISQTAAHLPKLSSVSTPFGKKESTRATSGRLANGQLSCPNMAIFENGPGILETAARGAKISSIATPCRKRVYVQLLKIWPMTKFHAQIWQFWKSASISETAARRAKINSNLTPWGRKRV